MLNFFFFFLQAAFGEIVMNHAAKLFSLHEIRSRQGKNRRVHPHLNDAVDGKGCALHSRKWIEIKPNQPLCSVFHCWLQSQSIRISSISFWKCFYTRKKPEIVLSGFLWWDFALYYKMKFRKMYYMYFKKVKTMCDLFRWKVPTEIWH